MRSSSEQTTNLVLSLRSIISQLPNYVACTYEVIVGVARFLPLALLEKKRFGSNSIVFPTFIQRQAPL